MSLFRHSRALLVPCAALLLAVASPQSAEGAPLASLEADGLQECIDTPEAHTSGKSNASKNLDKMGDALIAALEKQDAKLICVLAGNMKTYIAANYGWFGELSDVDAGWLPLLDDIIADYC